jgi:hypothetical protein
VWVASGGGDGFSGLAEFLGWQLMKATMFAPRASSPAVRAARSAVRKYRWASAWWEASKDSQAVRRRISARTPCRRRPTVSV